MKGSRMNRTAVLLEWQYKSHPRQIVAPYLHPSLLPFYGMNCVRLCIPKFIYQAPVRFIVDKIFRIHL